MKNFHLLEVNNVHMEQSANSISFSVTAHSIGQALLSLAQREATFQGDDAGCDWCTESGITYITMDGNRDWIASTNPEIAVLVDAANLLRLGHTLSPTPVEQAVTR